MSMTHTLASYLMKLIEFGDHTWSHTEVAPWNALPINGIVGYELGRPELTCYVPTTPLAHWAFRWPLVENEELATKWLKILVTIGFLSDLLLNMSNFDWPNYKRLKLTINLVTN